MTVFTKLRLGVCILTLALNLRAELAWEARELRLTAAPGQSVVTGEYRYKNTGRTAVAITSVAPSCSCAQVEPAAVTVPPGSTGTLRLTYTIGGKTGQQTAKIAVQTSDAPEQPTALTLAVFIQEAVALQPRLVYWTRGGEAAEKSIEIVAAEPQRWQVVAVSCADPAFRVALAPPGAAGHPRVLVQPLNLRQPAQAAIRVELQAEGRRETQLAYAAIK
ncbi:MAG: DUF1573 domain-containing protein [Opitutae bacterium]|nr:DUF1573 domain-containing protein [Opitutae bacterium]